MKRHKIMFCKNFMPGRRESECSEERYESGKQSSAKRQRLDSNATCDCGFTLQMKNFSDQICHACVRKNDRHKDNIKPITIRIRGCYSEIHGGANQEDVKKQMFQSAQFTQPDSTPMYLRINEPVRLDLIPDDPNYNTLRQTMQNLTTFQSSATYFCEHSEFWILLRKHAKRCKVIKELPKDTREEMMNMLNLTPRSAAATVSANILYWFVFSPHAAAVCDVGPCNYFPIHPILSMSDRIRAWSPKKGPSILSFFQFLKTRLPQKKTVPDDVLSEVPSDVPKIVSKIPCVFSFSK